MLLRKAGIKSLSVFGLLVFVVGVQAQISEAQLKQLAQETVEGYVTDSLPAFVELYRLDNQDQNDQSFALRYDWSSDNDWTDDFGSDNTDFNGSSSSFFARGNYAFRDQVVNPSEYSEVGGSWSKRSFSIQVENELTPEQGQQVQQCVASGGGFTSSKTPEQCRRELGFKDLSMAYQYFDIDAHVKMEGDQDFGQRNYVFGIEANYSRSFNSQYFVHPTLTLGVEQVDPKNNELRLAVMTDNEIYSRAYAKFSFISNLGTFQGQTIKLSVASRYFKELDADPAIEAADLDAFTYTAVAIQIPAVLIPGFDNTANSFVLSYSKGDLPFSRAEEKTFELGFRHNVDFGALF